MMKWLGEDNTERALFGAALVVLVAIVAIAATNDPEDYSDGWRHGDE